MLLLKNADGSRVVVLDQTDLITLRTSTLTSPDGRLLVALSPDLPWTAAAFQEAAEQPGGLSAQKILSILATSLAKPAPGTT